MSIKVSTASLFKKDKFFIENAEARLTLAARSSPLNTYNNFPCTRELLRVGMLKLKIGCLPFSSSESTRKIDMPAAFLRFCIANFYQKNAKHC